MFDFIKLYVRNRKALKDNKAGDLEFDELGKLILGLTLLIILIVIVTVVIKGELDTQGEDVKGVFDMLR